MVEQRRYDLRRETLAAPVDGRHAEGVEHAGLEAQRKRIAADLLAVVEVAGSGGRIDHKARSLSRWLLRVVDGLPRESHLAAPAVDELHLQTVGRQRGNGTRLVVHVADIPQDSLIDGACQREAEVRVLAVAHVGETLVRHRLEDGAGHFGQSRLRVIAVAQVALGPADAEACPDVAVGIVEQVTGQLSRHHTRQFAVEHIGAVFLSGVDGQGSVDRAAVGIVARIAVNG